MRQLPFLSSLDEGLIRSSRSVDVWEEESSLFSLPRTLARVCSHFKAVLGYALSKQLGMAAFTS